MLIDLAVQAVHVTNQSMIYAARPEARSRLAGAYMVFYSVGIGGGSVASTATYAAAGWTAVCALGATISLAALAVWTATTSRSWQADRAGRAVHGAGVVDLAARRSLPTRSNDLPTLPEERISQACRS